MRLGIGPPFLVGAYFAAGRQPEMARVGARHARRRGRPSLLARDGRVRRRRRRERGRWVGSRLGSDDKARQQLSQGKMGLAKIKLTNFYHKLCTRVVQENFS